MFLSCKWSQDLYISISFNEDEGEHEGPSFVVIRYHHLDGIFGV